MSTVSFSCVSNRSARIQGWWRGGKMEAPGSCWNLFCPPLASPPLFPPLHFSLPLPIPFPLSYFLPSLSPFSLSSLEESSNFEDRLSYLVWKSTRERKVDRGHLCKHPMTVAVGEPTIGGGEKRKPRKTFRGKRQRGSGIRPVCRI